jgi:rhamnogalacturonan endolyase
MKRKLMSFLLVFALIAVLGVPGAVNPGEVGHATGGIPVVEFLNRGIVSAGTGNGNLVSWRLLASDPEGTIFRLYRDGERIHETTATGATGFLDSRGNATSRYRVDAVSGGRVFCSQDKVIRAAHTPDDNRRSGASFDIPLSPPTRNHHPNDITVGDVDGDGEYELFIKWDPDNARDNAHDGVTGEVYIECIKLDGTSLWRINLGPNIRAGAHYTQMLVADFDLSGSAKLIVKTADGTIDGLGRRIGSTAIHRNEAGRILTGDEFLTLFCGRTGENLHTIPYNPGRGRVADWGDNWGNRVDRFLGAVAYLDGVRPSAVMIRGYYTRMAAAAYDVVDNRLVEKWFFDSGFNRNDRNNPHAAAHGQGNHNVMPANVHGDGRQSIFVGSAAISPEGGLLWAATRFMLVSLNRHVRGFRFTPATKKPPTGFHSETRLQERKFSVKPQGEIRAAVWRGIFWRKILSAHYIGAQTAH